MASLSRAGGCTASRCYSIIDRPCVLRQLLPSDLCWPTLAHLQMQYSGFLGTQAMWALQIYPCCKSEPSSAVTVLLPFFILDILIDIFGPIHVSCTSWEHGPMCCLTASNLVCSQILNRHPVPELSSCPSTVWQSMHDELIQA